MKFSFVGSSTCFWEIVISLEANYHKCNLACKLFQKFYQSLLLGWSWSVASEVPNIVLLSILPCLPHAQKCNSFNWKVLKFSFCKEKPSFLQKNPLFDIMIPIDLLKWHFSFFHSRLGSLQTSKSKKMITISWARKWFDFLPTSSVLQQNERY